MSTLRQWLTPWCLFAVAVATSCESTTQTLAPSNSAAPQISSVSPSAPEPNLNPQLLTITGDRFATGITLLLTPPNQSAVEVPASAIQLSSSTSLQTSLVLSLEGTYSLSVKNLNNIQSNPFPFTVRRIVPGTPTLTSLSPPTAARSAGPVIVTLTGASFETGLAVTMFSPSGSPITLIGASITSVTATSVQFSVVLNQVGLFTFQVMNPAGALSNTLSISVS